MKWAHKLSDISAYKRCDSHLTTKTAHGAIVTLLGVLLGVTLTIHELSWFLSGGGIARTTVDLARRHDLGIHIDITFPAIPCAGLSVDVMDASGSSGNDVSKGKDVQLHKVRLDGSGRKIGGRDGEYHTPQSQKLVQDKQGTVMQIDLGAAMAQMGDMEKEIDKHEGCRVFGDISVRRVAGKLHFAVHQQSFVDVLPQMLTGHVLPKLTNMSHIINKVAFGPEFPGQINPLDGFHRVTQAGEALKAYKYFLKIVPTEYLSRMGFVLETNQYSVNEYALTLAGSMGHKLANDTSAVVSDPFVDFSYDMSPIMMTLAQSPADLLHFIVRLCAVVGGVLSVTRMADKLVHALLVATGFVAPAPSIKAKHRNSSMGGYNSLRSSLAGSGIDPLNGSLPGSGRSSYAGGSGSPTGARATAFNSNGGLLPDSSMYQRQAGGSYPGSHPLSTFGSGGSSLFAMGSGSLGGGVGAGPVSGAGSLGGASAIRDSYSGNNPVAATPGSSFGGGTPSNLGPGSSGGSPTKAAGGFGSLGGFGPAVSGPLYKAGSLNSMGSGSRGVSSAGGTGPGGFGSEAGGAAGGSLLSRMSSGAAAGAGFAGSGSGAGSISGGGGVMLGGFGSAPLAAVGGSSGGGSPMVMNSLGTSRLSTASGPGSRTASGPGSMPPSRTLSTLASSPQKQQ